MPRKIKATKKMIIAARYAWYRFHTKNRDECQALPEKLLELYRKLAQNVPWPEMTVYGGFQHNYPPRDVYKLAAQYNVENIHYLCPWYLSDEGWKVMQDLFLTLPEPIDLSYTSPCVRIGADDLSVHRLDEFSPELQAQR